MLNVKKKQITALVVLCIGNQKQTKNIGFFIFSFCWWEALIVAICSNDQRDSTSLLLLGKLSVELALTASIIILTPALQSAPGPLNIVRDSDK